MTDQWYYTEQNERRGPVSEEQLKELASAGRLKPTVKVWKKGMAGWEPASKIAILTFPRPADDGPPPLSPDEPPLLLPQGVAQHGQSVSARAKGMAASFVERGKSAAQLVAKQAERAKLVNMTLPTAYQALGKHIYEADSHREENAEAFQRIDVLQADIAALRTQDEKAEGLAAKAKAAAKTAADTAHLQPLKMKLSRAFIELGKAAFEKHGGQSGPEEVVRPITDFRARVEKFDAEMAQLSQSSAGQVFTPKRIAIGGLCVAVLLILLLVRGVFFGAGSGIVGTWTKHSTFGGKTGVISVRFTSGDTAVMNFMGEDHAAKYSLTSGRVSIQENGHIMVFPVEFTSDEMIVGPSDTKGVNAENPFVGTWRREAARTAQRSPDDMERGHVAAGPKRPGEEGPMTLPKRTSPPLQRANDVVLDVSDDHAKTKLLGAWQNAGQDETLEFTQGNMVIWTGTEEHNGCEAARPAVRHSPHSSQFAFNSFCLAADLILAGRHSPRDIVVRFPRHRFKTNRIARR